jgi:Flp pilus assembly protein TadD
MRLGVVFRQVGATSIAGLIMAPGCTSLEAARLYRDGTAALDRGSSAEALRMLERAAELLPETSEIQNHLGSAYAAEGRHAEALAAWRRSVALDCENQAAQRNLLSAERRMLELGEGSTRGQP